MISKMPIERDQVFEQQLCTHNCVTEKELGFVCIYAHLRTGLRTSFKFRVL